MPLSVGMADALEDSTALVFLAVEIVLPSGTLRLLDGAGSLVIDGDIFVGGDPTLGVLAGLEAISDGLGAEAPALRLVINPPSNTAAADLADPTAQGGAVSLWIGVLDTPSFTILGDPYLLFLGEIDQATLSVGQGSRVLALDCVSAFERFFEDDEGIRLTYAWHKSVWAGELGLEFIPQVDRQVPWGSDAPRPAVVRYAGGTRVNPAITPQDQSAPW